MNYIVDNKRIARNTLFLYFRMFITMGISLYTSRLVLNILGVDDFGIYNVVGGVVAMFSVISGSLSTAISRFITFELGRDTKDRLKTIFSSAVTVQVIIALLVCLLVEICGVWFLNNKMNIPIEKMEAANWVLQCSMLIFMINLISVPYNAAIIAHEQMKVFAYISILEVLLKLGVVFILYVTLFEKLILYAILLLFVAFIIQMTYVLYCKKHFEESSYVHSFDVALLKEMSGFAGWSFWGSLAGVLYTQGLNMLLNVFFGPVVNAARGIAVQAQSAVQQFVTNFQMAINPQITKTFAAGNLEQMHSLMFRSARFSFILLFFITLPVLLETDFLLTIWLKTVPDDTVVFIHIMICISLIYTTANPCVIANQATGKVKVYQAVVGGVLLTILPISYTVLKLGAPAYSVFIVHFCVELVAQFSRMYMLRKLINLPIRQYLNNIYIPIVGTVFVSIILPIFVHMQFEEGWLRFIVVGFTCVLSVSLSAFFIGFTKNEREFFLDKGLRILKGKLLWM